MWKIYTRVLTEADTRDLISLEDYKIDAGITISTDDEYLQRRISEASAAIEVFTDRVFAVEGIEDTFVRDENCEPNYRLPIRTSRFPIIDVVSVSQDDMDLVEGTDFLVDQRGGKITRKGGAWGTGDIVVTYDAGYETIPADLQGAVREIVKAMQFSKTRDPLLRSENILSGLYAYTLFAPGEVPAGTVAQVVPQLFPYRRVLV